MDTTQVYRCLLIIDGLDYWGHGKSPTRAHADACTRARAQHVDPDTATTTRVYPVGSDPTIGADAL